MARRKHTTVHNNHKTQVSATCSAQVVPVVRQKKSPPDYKTEISELEKKLDADLNAIRCTEFVKFNEECRRLKNKCNEDILVLEAKNKDPELIARMEQKAVRCYTEFTEDEIAMDLERIIHKDKSIIILYAKDVGKQGIDEWTQKEWEKRTGRPHLRQLPISGRDAMYIYGGEVIKGTTELNDAVSRTKKSQSLNEGKPPEGKDSYPNSDKPSSLDFVNECVRTCEICSEEHKITEYMTAKFTRESGGSQLNAVANVRASLDHAKNLRCEIRMHAVVDGGFWTSKIEDLKNDHVNHPCVVVRQCQDAIVHVV
jgi:hypothetical protein